MSNWFKKSLTAGLLDDTSSVEVTDYHSSEDDPCNDPAQMYAWQQKLQNMQSTYSRLAVFYKQKQSPIIMDRIIELDKEIRSLKMWLKMCLKKTQKERMERIRPTQNLTV